MKSVLIGGIGLMGLWATDTLSVALQILVALVTIIVLLYEKHIFKSRCSSCFYYNHYYHDKRQNDKRDEK